MGNAPPVLRAAVAVAIALAAGAVLHAVGAWPGASGDALFETFAYGLLPFVAAASALARASMVENDRAAWACLGAGLLSWAVGNVVWIGLFDKDPGQAVDMVLFLALYPLAFAHLVLLLRARSPRLPSTIWLDGVAGALTVAAVGVALLVPGVVSAAHATGLAIVSSLSYPLLDIGLIAFVVVMFTVARWQPGRDWVALALGLGGLAIGDGLWALHVGAGVSGTAAVSAAMWCAGMTLLACAPWQRSRPLPPVSSVNGFVVLWPFALFLCCLAIVAGAAWIDLPTVGVLMALGAMLVSIARAAATFLELRSLPETQLQARTDELTGLTNRRGFFDALTQRLTRHPGRPAAILMLDLDRFKELNDTLGHQAGDRLLAQLGPRLAASLRPADTLARLGGDEFAVLCPGASGAGARDVARRLQRALDEPFAVGDLRIHVDASIGIAGYPDDGATPEELLQRADVAMYQAKGGGTEVEHYDAARDEHSRDRLALVGELRRALDRGAELELHYQPQACLRTDRIVGVEALVRWRHPARGLLGPSAFLDAAEGAGLMRRLGREVLRQAVAQAAAWHRHGHAVPVAVNLSTADLVDDALAGQVEELLRRHDLPGSWLRLEITENTVMAQPDRVVETLHALRALGCTVSLDDFGTGHASLAHLVHLPVDELKIDRSFVQALDADDAGAAAIIRSVALLGRDLDLVVVAEGVESPRAWGQLVAAGCSVAQGYLLSPPLRDEALRPWLAARDEAAAEAA